MEYKVKVENFEGPIDLLLFFIQRDKLNIYDIPIAHITKNFLDYIKMMDTLNIDLGGEFIYMASLLMKIKSTMLLPLSKEDEENIEDPRAYLVERLLEYKQFKKVSEELHHQYTFHAMHYPKGTEMLFNEKKDQIYEFLPNITLFNLTSVFQDLINRMQDVKSYEMQEEPVHLDDQITFLKKEISAVKRLYFKNLIPILKTKVHLVVTFLAILEMLRNNEISIEQDSSFGELIIIGIYT